MSIRETYHTSIVRRVKGMATDQYIQIFFDTTHFPDWLSVPGEKLKKLMLNTALYHISSSGENERRRTQVKVAGRKAIVITAIVFIAALSVLVALLTSFITSLSRWAIKL